MDLGTSVFLFRDFLEYILPTVIGALLFVPALAPPGEPPAVEIILLASVVLGYVISSPVGGLAKTLHGWLKKVSPRLAAFYAQDQFASQCWDYDALWACLESEGREYLYLTSSYMQFYRVTGLYLGAYALLNAGKLAAGAAQGVPLMAVRTTVVGNWSAPALVLGLVSLALAGFMLRDASTEFRELFARRGYYPLFARRLHTREGNIASGVWGQVVRRVNGKEVPLPEVEVVLSVCDGAGNEFQAALSGPDGVFLFPGVFAVCVGHTCRVSAEVDGIRWSEEMELSPTTIPEFKITVRSETI